MTSLLTTLTLAVLVLTLADGRRNRQRSGDPSGTDAEPLPPRWSRRMSRLPEVEGMPGEVVVLSCPADGHPRPEVTWLRDGVPLQREPGSRRLVLGEGEKVRLKNWNLKMVDVKPSQAGNYTCMVKNEHGQIHWTFRVRITVAVLQPPTLVEVPVNVTVVLGGTARLACRPHTDPEYRDFVTVQWLKHYSINGSTKDEQGYPLFRSVEETVDKYVMPSDEVLVVENLTMDDIGWYTCVVDIRGYAHAATHATAYVNVISSLGIHTTVPPQTTTERRKRKKHRKKSRGRNRKPEVATEAPSTEESSTQEVELETAEGDFKEPEVDFEGPEVVYEKPEVSTQKVEQTDTEPKIGRSKEAGSNGPVVKVNLLLLLLSVLGLASNSLLWPWQSHH